MVTEEQKELLKIAADLATIATLLIALVDKIKKPDGKKKPRKDRKPSRQSKGKR